MDSIELLSSVSANIGKQCTLILKNGDTSRPLCFGSKVDDYGVLCVCVSEGKSEKLVPHNEIKEILF